MRRYTAILCLVLAVGCGDDSDGPPKDNRLIATITQPGSPVSGVVDITFTLTQRQDIPGDVIPEYSTALDGRIARPVISGMQSSTSRCHSTPPRINLTFASTWTLRGRTWRGQGVGDL